MLPFLQTSATYNSSASWDVLLKKCVDGSVDLFRFVPALKMICFVCKMFQYQKGRTWWQKTSLLIEWNFQIVCYSRYRNEATICETKCLFWRKGHLECDNNILAMLNSLSIIAETKGLLCVFHVFRVFPWGWSLVVLLLGWATRLCLQMYFKLFHAYLAYSPTMRLTSAAIWGQ